MTKKTMKDKTIKAEKVVTKILFKDWESGVFVGAVEEDFVDLAQDIVMAVRRHLA